MKQATRTDCAWEGQDLYRLGGNLQANKCAPIDSLRNSEPIGGKRRVTTLVSEKGLFCNLQTWEHGAGILCGRHTAEDKKSKIKQTGNQERKERLRVDGCLERAQSLP
jgi:hypothetical protein